MIGLIVALLSVLLPLAHLGFSSRPGTRDRVVRLLFLYALVFDVGVIGLLFGFIPHVFFADEAARRREVRSSSKSGFTMAHGASSASLAFGLAARFGLRPASDGPSSCSGPHTATSIKRYTRETMLRTIS